MTFKIATLEFKEQNPTKEVIYFGYELIVPIWTKYIATNKDNKIVAFDTEPSLLEDDDYWSCADIWSCDDYDNFQVLKNYIMTYEGDWKTSLQEV